MNIKKYIIITLIVIGVFVFQGCNQETTSNSTTNTTSSSNTSSWDEGEITYFPEQIRLFGSGNPSGVANYNQDENTVSIWNTLATLDNYGGIQTPTLKLDFSKAVIFEMEVVSVYSEYIVQLAVEGEDKYFYVLSDENQTGKISVNVVDSMLSDKYRSRNTQPDPGYQSGWLYQDQIKNCSFHILAKGPDGERQTAELVISKIAIYNNQVPIESVNITSSQIQDNRLELLKGDETSLSAVVLPDTVENKEIIWRSSDESVALVDQFGNLEAIGVGQAQIIALSSMDQSKSKEITVDVLSGFEDLSLLKNKLTELNYEGSSIDVELFLDLFNTKLGQNQYQGVSVSDYLALSSRLDSTKVYLENYFNPMNSSHLNEAINNSLGNDAYLSIDLNHQGLATIYRMVNNQLFKEVGKNSLDIAYAFKNSDWSKSPSRNEKVLIVWDNGDVYKLEVVLLDARLMGDFKANDLADTDQWIIPDRTKQNIDSVIHALSPASVTLSGQEIYLKQNKYPESKYSFGGIVSEVFQANTNKTTQIIINITSLNQKTEFVKTMWEIKIIYYQSDGVSVINTNPLKVASSNVTGVHIIDFVPAYSHFRLYLVANGSDIGDQFADATVGIASLKIYEID